MPTKEDVKLSPLRKVLTGLVATTVVISGGVASSECLTKPVKLDVEAEKVCLTNEQYSELKVNTLNEIADGTTTHGQFKLQKEVMDREPEFKNSVLQAVQIQINADGYLDIDSVHAFAYALPPAVLEDVTPENLINQWIESNQE